MNILILTGKFGMGHQAAAESLRQQLLSGFPKAEVTVVDFPAYAMPDVSDIMYKSFQLLVSYGSPLFNTYYKATSLGRPDARPPLTHLFLDKLVELLYQYRPDAVVATHPFCAQVVSRLKEKNKYRLDLPLITCITDVTSHPEWINGNTDCYLVPSREVRKSLIEKGVNPTRICVTGIPVRKEFYELTRHRDGARRKLLIMGGGLGLLPTSEDFYRELNSIPDTHVTIITGRNQRLFERLRGRWENIEVIGYTDRVWAYMQDSDMIVTKPGGITLFESIFAQVPIFTWQPSLCQEKNNARWLVQMGIGWVAEQENCVGEIRAILQDEQKLSQAAARMGKLREQLEEDGLNRIIAAIGHSMEVA